MLDLSTHKDLGTLAGIVGDMRSAADPLGIRFLLIGAMARDVMLGAYGIASSRRTQDVDFAFMVPTWAAFQDLRDALQAGGRFARHESGLVHKLRHGATGYEIDVIPFGAIENEDRTITLPPDNDFSFNCFGVDEAYAARREVTLPGAVIADVASIPALAILKIAAFNDRKYRQPGKDAPDLLLLATKYLDCDNMDRLAEQHADLLAGDFEYELGSARLLARDMAAILDKDGVDRLTAILYPECDPDGALLMVQQSRVADMEKARKITAALAQELAAQRGKTR